MKLKEAFLGHRDFRSRGEIVQHIRNSKNFNAKKEDVSRAGVLLIFSCQKQQSWLIATNERLYSILDDIRKDSPHINWSIPRSKIAEQDKEMLPFKVSEKSYKTGSIRIGSKRPRLFTKSLFEAIDIEKAIKELIKSSII